MSDMKQALDELFSDADEIIDELGDEFNFHEFWQKAVHKHQHAYIDLLVACSHLDWPFDQAHQKMGAALRRAAEDAGYGYERIEHGTTNIFGRTTTLTIYRKE